MQTASVTEQKWIVEPEQVGTRLDRFLSTCLTGVSRTSIQQLIQDSEVLVNDKKSKSGYALRLDDEVVVLHATTNNTVQHLVATDIPLDIVYEDDDILIVNKPAGLVVHPAPGHYEDTLVNALLAHYPQLGKDAADLRPGIVHRLDRDTSGLLIVAKNIRAQAALIEQMKEHVIEKRYLALVEGVVALDRGTIDAPIGRDTRNRQQMTITSVDSREARTHFKVQERFSRFTLLLLQLETGRTHQIRVHLQAIKHPVVGDTVYGSGRVFPHIQLQRQFLHAYQLRFKHPISNELIEVEAPLPDDLQAVLSDPNVL